MSALQVAAGGARARTATMARGGLLGALLALACLLHAMPLVIAGMQNYTGSDGFK